MVMRIGSLFSGAGGLDMAVEAVFGGETVWHCELDSAASKVLAARWPGVPNLGDITAVDWTAIEPVDILCGGYPCQPFSAAGQRKGTDDERNLWPYFAEAICALRPRFVVLENVAGHRSMGFDRVLGDLAEIGYDAQWSSVRASDVGAPHRRERLFVLAHPSGDGWPRLNGGTSGASACDGRKWLAAGSDGRAATSDTTRDGWDEGRPESAWLIGGSDAAVSGDGPVDLLPTPCARDFKDATASPGAVARNTPSLGAIEHYLLTPQAFDRVDHIRTPEKIAETQGGCRNLRETVINELLSTPQARDYKGVPADGFNTANLCRDVALLPTPTAVQGWGKYEPAIRRWESLTRPAPSPTEPNTKGNPRLSAAFSEWMMGWPDGWVTDVEGISRNDALRIIGNGVCVQQCVAALRWLLSVAQAAA